MCDVLMLKSKHEDEDVVVDTFQQAWRKASSYEPSRRAVSTWLLTIGRRRALDRLRAKARRREESLTREGWVLAEMPSNAPDPSQTAEGAERRRYVLADRKSTRLNSSHLVISYAVFCLEKKKKEKT